MSKFFIERPIFSSVVALFIVLAGALAIPALPVSQYPDLGLPQVAVNARYVGASAEVVESAVTTPLEEAINGVEGMRYLASNSTSDGASSITVTFDRERNLDLATVDVQNRVNSVLGRLPAEVRNSGVTVSRTSSSIIMGVGLYATDDGANYDNVFISNYADRYIVDALKRIKGVGNVRIFGERRYAMRVWLDVAALNVHQLNPSDLVAALREQNLQVAAGQFGQSPAPSGQTFQFTVRADGRFSTKEDFDDVVVKIDADGNLIRLSDVARIELGAERYTTNFRFSGREAVGIGVFQLPSANALETHDLVRDALEDLRQSFPPGIEYVVAFNPTAIISESIDEVLTTLALAILLVIAVIFLFLQRWQTTVIPALTIPISLVGTFAFVQLFGYSINTLTLFALTLATGLVVDDAIVVTENIERHSREQGDGGGPADMKAAAIGSMRELFGAIVATSLVVIAVFLPVSFFPGTTGILYQQFAVTISFSVAISSVVALTLAPSLAARLLRPGQQADSGIFRPFNRALAWATTVYRAILQRTLRQPILIFIPFAAIIAASAALNRALPRGFVPVEDQGYFITLVRTPAGASLDYTTELVKELEKIILADDAVENIFAPVGFSFTGTAPNRATLFTTLRDREDRPPAGAIIGRLRRQASAAIKDAQVLMFPPPPIRGLGSLGGFEMQLQDRTGRGIGALSQTANSFSADANAQPELTGVYSALDAYTPVLDISLDREKTRALGIPINEAYGAVQTLLGSSYTNDFTFADRSYRVYVQARPQDRDNPVDLSSYHLRSRQDVMVPLSNLVTVSPSSAPQNIAHFNLFRAATVSGNARPGVSSGDALAALERVATNLPQGYGYEWSGASAEEKESGQELTLLFALAGIMMLLVLAAQFESITMPLVIVTAVPTAILGALFGQLVRGLQNDVFCQVALLMLVGLAAKNAILIVEFARTLQERAGLNAATAVLDAASLRLRPVLMTSLSFVLGTLPLVFASGAGELSRRSLGTAIFSGMTIATVLTLLLIPAFYVLAARLSGARNQATSS